MVIVVPRRIARSKILLFKSTQILLPPLPLSAHGVSRLSGTYSLMRLQLRLEILQPFRTEVLQGLGIAANEKIFTLRH